MTTPENSTPSPETPPAAPAKKTSVWKYFGLVLVIVIAGIMAAASTRPEEFRVVRTQTISAKPEAVFEQINNFHKWNAWSPWAKMDPNAKNTFEGSEDGVGAKFSWDGNSQVGAGHMTLLESTPGQYVKIKLEFERPMTCTNVAEFRLKPEGDATTVAWTVYGPYQFIGKVMSLFCDMDKMVGSDFEKGLNNLKEIVEKK